MYSVLISYSLKSVLTDFEIGTLNILIKIKNSSIYFKLIYDNGILVSQQWLFVCKLGTQKKCTIFLQTTFSEHNKPQYEKFVLGTNI